MKIILSYLGKGGEYIPGIPARDLTQLDIDHLVASGISDVDSLIASGVYQPVKVKKKTKNKKSTSDEVAKPVPETFECVECGEMFYDWHKFHRHVEDVHNSLVEDN